MVDENGLVLSFNFEPERGTANVPRNRNAYSHDRRDVRRLSEIACLSIIVNITVQELKNTVHG